MDVIVLLYICCTACKWLLVDYALSHEASIIWLEYGTGFPEVFSMSFSLHKGLK
jgi:hypothetical protein